MPITLDNPYLKNKSKYDLPIGNFGSTPNVVTFGDTEVITNKPIITTNKSFDLPTGNFKFEESQASKDFKARMKVQEKLNTMPNSQSLVDEKKQETGWKSLSKTKKTLIIGGSAVGVLLLGFVIYKAVKR